MLQVVGAPPQAPGGLEMSGAGDPHCVRGRPRLREVKRDDFEKTHPFRVSLFMVFLQKTAKYRETAFVSRSSGMIGDPVPPKRAKTPLVGRLQMAIVRAFLTPVAAAKRGTLMGFLGTDV